MGETTDDIDKGIEVRYNAIKFSAYEKRVSHEEKK